MGTGVQFSSEPPKLFIIFSLRMSSSDKMRKILDKINDYQSKIDDNIEKFNTLVYKHFSNVIDNSNEQVIFITYLPWDWYHINYDGFFVFDIDDFINCLEEKIKTYWENYQCKDWQEFQEDFIDKCQSF